MKKNAKKHLTPEQLKQLEELKRKQLEVFDDQLEIMKLARDTFWAYSLDKIDNLSEAKNMIQIIQNAIFSGFEKKKDEFTIKDLDLAEYAKGYEDLIKCLENKSVMSVEKSLNAMSQILDAKVREELKEKKLKTMESKDMFYYDDALLAEKRENLIKGIEEDYKKRAV